MADEITIYGDISRALRNLMQRGMQGQMGSGFEGLREMIERLKQQSRDRLERYDLASMIDELKQRMEEILQLERDDLESQTTPNPQQPAPGQQGSQRAQDASSSSTTDPAAPTSQPSASNQGSRPASPRQANDADRQQRLQFLDQLPPDFAGRAQELNHYEFFNPEAQQAFDDLMDMLKQQAMGNMFKEMAQRMANMTPQERQRLQEMLADLNQMLDQQIWGENPDFESFMQKHGDMFGPNPPQSLEALTEQLASQMAQMQSLFNSLPQELQQELQDMMAAAFDDQSLGAELAELQANLDFLSSDERQAYEFSGSEGLPLDQAMHMMDELQKIDALQEQLAQVGRQGGLETVDAEALEQILGPEGRQELEKLR